MKWFEILSLGLDVVTYSEIHKTREHIEGRNNSDAIKILQEEILSSLKNLVFASLKSAEAMQGYLDAAPQKVFVGSALLDWRLESIHIKPEIFPQFEEKEYTKKTQDTISELINSSKKKLSVEEIQEGEKCVQYILEMPELNKTIETEKENDNIRKSQVEAKNIQDELKQTNTEWEPLEKKARQRKTLGIASAFLAPVLFCCCGVNFTFPLIGASDSTLPFGLILSLLLTVITGAGFIGGLIFAFGKPSERYAELLKIRNEITSRSPRSREITPSTGNFQNMNTADLNELRNSRQLFINKILGDTDKDFNYDMIFLED